jgi:hypothetical protein
MKYAIASIVVAALAMSIWGIVAATSGPPRTFDSAPLPIPAPLGADVNQTPISRAEAPIDPLSAEVQNMVPGLEPGTGDNLTPAAKAETTTVDPLNSGASLNPILPQADPAPAQSDALITEAVTDPAPVNSQGAFTAPEAAATASDPIPSLTDAQMKELGFLP